LEIDRIYALISQNILSPSYLAKYKVILEMNEKIFEEKSLFGPDGKGF